jgi:hypothetical protein
VPKAFWRKPSPRCSSFGKGRFQIVNQGKHVVMSDGIRILTVPRHNPVNEYTMGGIVRDAGLTIEKFKSSYGAGPANMQLERTAEKRGRSTADR